MVMNVWTWIAVLNTCLCLSAGAQTNPSIDGDALNALKAAAEAAHSDAVIVMRDGDVIADWRFGVERHPIETMSVLKSIVAVAVGRLVALGKIEGLDQPVHQLYPEWNQGQKKLITNQTINEPYLWAARQSQCGSRDLSKPRMRFVSH